MKKSSIERYFWIYILTGVIIAGCGNKNKSSHSVYNDSPKNGAINISVDESFKPVISEQIKVYESSYPGTKISASYKSEADCFRDLQKDSTRMIIVARGLTSEESSYYKSKLSFEPQFGILAYDAVSVIVNINAKDSIYTLRRLTNMLSGKDTSHIIVADGTSATSTVRYLLDCFTWSSVWEKCYGCQW
jgi:phosphate transport system substrate-binding protein